MTARWVPGLTSSRPELAAAWPAREARVACTPAGDAETGGRAPLRIYRSKVISKPSEKLKAAPPAWGSRYQAWKFQTEPAATWAAGCGGLV